MIPRLRTIAILMLLAGLALGIFTSRALRAMGPDALAASTAGRQPKIEVLVDLYQSEFRLDPQQADHVRRVLYAHDRAVAAKIWELRQRHADEFLDLQDEATQEIETILAEARKGQ